MPYTYVYIISSQTALAQYFAHISFYNIIIKHSVLETTSILDKYNNYFSVYLPKKKRPWTRNLLRTVTFMEKTA